MAKTVSLDLAKLLTEVERLQAKNADLLGRVRRMERIEEAASELVEVAELRGDNCLPLPPDDPKLWTARMQTAWNELEEALRGEAAPDA